MGLRLTFIGPPGGGKGTQAWLLEADGFLHVSTGDMLRAEIERRSDCGRAIAAIVGAGGLVEDHVISALVEAFLGAHEKDPIVLDGYPRTLPQARHLAKLGVDAAVFFQISDEVLLDRLAGRAAGDGIARRMDDLPAVQVRRLAAYRAQEALLLDFYRKAGIAQVIDADRPKREVHADIEVLVATLRAAAPAVV